jgi:hypothetical protein
MLTIIVEIISCLVTFVSIVVAIWQTIKNSNMKKYIQTEAMEVYSDTAVLLGSTQGCLAALQDGNTNVGIQCAGQSEGMAQALFTRSIKNIHHHFSYTRKDVDDWINNQKVHAVHKNAFLTYAEK